MDIATATITCPTCGHAAMETIPTDRCLFFYECRACKAVLRPKSGDCCVFCSYGDRRCAFRKPEKSKRVTTDGRPNLKSQFVISSFRVLLWKALEGSKT